MPDFNCKCLILLFALDFGSTWSDIYLTLTCRLLEKVR